jgi:hypothetical protein
MENQKQERSPVELARESLGLSRREGALAAGVTYHALYEVETGLVIGIPVSLRQFFNVAGVDVEELEKRQRRWIQAQGALIRERMADHRK